MSLFFVHSSALRLSHKRSSPLTCRRTSPYANINQTSDSAREDEIAAKIANLRKQKRLKSQGSSSTGNQDEANTQRRNVGTPMSFQDLPDWKKEDIMQNQISEAEAFLNPSAHKPHVEPGTDKVKYKPKVSTWGVFPRPDNISKAFGGGKKVQPGGVDLSSEGSKKRDEAVKEKLAMYRKTRGIDLEREEEHREEIETALAKGEGFIRMSRPQQAIKALEPVVEYICDRSRLGGAVFLSLALAHDSLGEREKAKELYQRLRRNPFPEISGKAKQLLQGFDAMNKLKIEDETSRQGLRVTKFRVPDVSVGEERRYETAVGAGPTKSDPIDIGTSLLLLALIAGPIAFVLLVLGPASR